MELIQLNEKNIEPLFLSFAYCAVSVVNKGIKKRYSFKYLMNWFNLSAPGFYYFIKLWKSSPVGFWNTLRSNSGITAKI